VEIFIWASCHQFCNTVVTGILFQS